MYQLIVKSPEGDKIELLASQNKGYIYGAQDGAKALLDLFTDDMDLEDGYTVTVEKEGDDSTPQKRSEDLSFADKHS
tara:strand:+ start:400 stop:630 length:231 start_codon:yes stop_codon:yes gene_type:complete